MEHDVQWKSEEKRITCAICTIEVISLRNLTLQPTMRSERERKNGECVDFYEKKCALSRTQSKFLHVKIFLSLCTSRDTVEVYNMHIFCILR